MLGFPTTTVSVLRGSQVDSYGDEVDADTVVQSGIIASLHESSTHQVDDAAGQTPRVVRTSYCRLASTVDVQSTDRIKDERTGLVYGLVEIYTPANPTFPTDTRLTLERVT